MPGSSSIQQFVNDLRERKSNITRALDELFDDNPARHDANPAVATAVAWLRSPGAPPYKLVPDARTILRGLGVSTGELDHIDEWPHAQKKGVLDLLADAITNDKPYHFFWELTGGDAEETDVSTPGEVVFRSPRSKIRVMTALSGEVTVDVNPPKKP